MKIHNTTDLIIKVDRGQEHVDKHIKSIYAIYNHKINAYQLTIDTESKYYIVEDNCSTSNGQYISFSPIIYQDGNCLYDTDFDAYLDHPDYFYINLFIKHPKFVSNMTFTTPLKYQYLVTIFDIKNYFN